MYLDVACLIVLAIFGLIGFLKGFLSQLISIAAIVAGLLGTMCLSGPASDWAVGWLVPRAPELQPTLIRIGVFVVLLFTLYILAAATLEAIKKKLMHSFALQLNDRLLGMGVGILKGLALVLLFVLVCDGTRRFAERFVSPKRFENYRVALDASDVVSASRYLIGVSRDNMPTVSAALHRAEVWLQPLPLTNKPASTAGSRVPAATNAPASTPAVAPAAVPAAAPVAAPVARPAAAVPAPSPVRTNQPMPFTPPVPGSTPAAAHVRTNQPKPFTPPVPPQPLPGSTP